MVSGNRRDAAQRRRRRVELLLFALAHLCKETLTIIFPLGVDVLVYFPIGIILIMDAKREWRQNRTVKKNRAVPAAARDALCKAREQLHPSLNIALARHPPTPQPLVNVTSSLPVSPPVIHSSSSSGNLSTQGPKVSVGLSAPKPCPRMHSSTSSANPPTRPPVSRVSLSASKPPLSGMHGSSGSENHPTKGPTINVSLSAPKSPSRGLHANRSSGVSQTRGPAINVGLAASKLPSRGSDANTSSGDSPNSLPIMKVNSSAQELPPPIIQDTTSIRMCPTAATNEGLQGRNFTYQELEMATGNFSNVNKLGEGGSAVVYKGRLSDGKNVAIKCLKDISMDHHDFLKEVEILGHLHHRHIVRLIGWCISERNTLLVYQYLPRGTLRSHLDGRSNRCLDWPMRFKICLGSAKGLAYLHDECEPMIIHRDIKTDNILLDDSFQAKVADFGISKPCSDDKTHISTMIKGTHGYLDLEYHATGRLTVKSDVFSFGVVVLELITGKKPIFYLDEERIALFYWARPLLKRALRNGKYDALVDPWLVGKYDDIEMKRMIACANVCLDQSPLLRPSMSQIVQVLEGNLSIKDLSRRGQPVRGTQRALFKKYFLRKKET